MPTNSAYHTSTSKMPYRRNLISKYLFIWSGLCVFIGLVLNFLYTSDFEVELSSIKQAEKNLVKQARDDIEYELSRVVSDLRYMASQSALRTYLDRQNQDSLQALNEAFVSELHARNANYTQLRFIALNGWELARVNSQDGQPRVVPRSELQDKSGRYYVKESLKLSTARDIYVSPIDLNVEQGEIVVPHRPVIRFAMKIFRYNRPMGLLVLNYDARNMLDSMHRHGRILWLLNKNGYWLTGADKKLQWGFMYPERADTRFQNYYPDVWQQVHEDKNADQKLYGKGLFTHASINLNALGRVIDDGELIGDQQLLHIFAHISERQIEKIFSNVKIRYLILFLSAVLVTGVSLYLLYRSTKIHEETEDQARHNRLKFEQLVEHAPDAMVICRPDGTIVLVNKQAENLFGYSRKQLIGRAVDMLIPQAQRDHHADHVKSYVSKPTVRPMGTQGQDLKALRKDGSEFPVSISLSPIDSGEDMLVVSAIRDVSEERRTTRKKKRAS